VVLLIGYTALACWYHHINPDPNNRIVPTWTQMGQGFAEAVKVDPNNTEKGCWLVTDAMATAGRLFMGLFVGVVGAVIFGLLMGCFRTMEAFLLPPMALLAKIPPTAALAVFMILSGTNLTLFATIIAFGVLPTMSQAIFLAIRDVPVKYLFKVSSLGASTMDTIFHVIVPIVLPKTIDALRLSIGPALVYLIAAELLNGSEGFGYRIRLHSHMLNMSIVYPYLAMLATFGFALDFGLRGLQNCYARGTFGRRGEKIHEQ